jgi:AcrR family transcriptional regulator
MSDEGGADDPIRALQAQLVAVRRAQILDAATRVFASKGFNRATIRDVARDAGIADGTIYNYFANKDDLLIGLLDRLNDTERRPSSLALAASAPITDHVRAYLRERVEALWSNADLFRAVLPELLANPDLRARYYNEVIAPTMTLAEGALSGLIAGESGHDVELALSLRLIAGSLLGMLVLQLLGDETIAAHWQEIPNVLADLLIPSFFPDMPKDDGAH